MWSMQQLFNRLIMLSDKGISNISNWFKEYKVLICLCSLKYKNSSKMTSNMKGFKSAFITWMYRLVFAGRRLTSFFYSFNIRNLIQNLQSVKKNLEPFQLQKEITMKITYVVFLSAQLKNVWAWKKNKFQMRKIYFVKFN